MTAFTHTKVEELLPNVNLHILELKEISPEIVSFIDSKIVPITSGNALADINIIKIELVNFFESKSPSITMGAIAEFFVHIYLSMLGYKQECLFLNLEEGSIKKGFDGYYSKDGSEWIMESKSGSISSQDISHKSKINEAYHDLKDKVSGSVANNPWKNAYNHARHGDVATSSKIVDNIKSISDDFVLNNFRDISEFNIIPSATIFLDNVWISNNYDSIKSDIINLVERLTYKNLEIICFTKKSLQLFLDYLNMRN